MSRGEPGLYESGVVDMVRASRTSFLRFSGMNPMHREGFTRWCDESACAAERRGQGVTLGRVYPAAGAGIPPTGGIPRGRVLEVYASPCRGLQVLGQVYHPAARAAVPHAGRHDLGRPIAVSQQADSRLRVAAGIAHAASSGIAQAASIQDREQLLLIA